MRHEAPAHRYDFAITDFARRPVVARDPQAGRMAHDLRNILQIISGNLAMLSHRYTNDAFAMKHIDRALAGVDLGTRLAGIAIDGAEPLSDVRLCGIQSQRAALEAMLAEAAGPGIDVVLDIPALLHLVPVDPTELENVLLNLTINARDAMKGRGRLTVTFRNVCVHDQPAVELLVSDTGCGMPAAVRERAFEPFFTTKGRNGSGLGLATVRRFADDCGGTVAIESSEGTGTTFRLVLPSTPMFR